MRRIYEQVFVYVKLRYKYPCFFFVFIFTILFTFSLAIAFVFFASYFAITIAFYSAISSGSRKVARLCTHFDRS